MISATFESKVKLGITLTNDHIAVFRIMFESKVKLGITLTQPEDKDYGWKFESKVKNSLVNSSTLMSFLFE